MKAELYVPVDAQLDVMRIRILRAIRHFDWVQPVDLGDAIGIPGSHEDHLVRNNFDVTIGRLFRGGFLERMPQRGGFSLYRITPAGRALLERELSRSLAAA